MANCPKCDADDIWLMRWKGRTRCLFCHTTITTELAEAARIYEAAEKDGTLAHLMAKEVFGAPRPPGCGCDDFRPKHTEDRRDWYGCVDCWAKIKPGRVTVVTDEVPHTATTTGGV